LQPSLDPIHFQELLDHIGNLIGWKCLKHFTFSMCGTLHFLLLESSLVGHPKIKGSSRNTQTPYQGALMLRRGHSGRAVSFGASSSEACMISDSDSSGLIQTVMAWVTIWELLQVVNKTYWSGWEPIWSRLLYSPK
jgi:hypothetical protein